MEIECEGDQREGADVHGDQDHHGESEPDQGPGLPEVSAVQPFSEATPAAFGEADVIDEEEERSMDQVRTLPRLRYPPHRRALQITSVSPETTMGSSDEKIPAPTAIRNRAT